MCVQELAAGLTPTSYFSYLHTLSNQVAAQSSIDQVAATTTGQSCLLCAERHAADVYCILRVTGVQAIAAVQNTCAQWCPEVAEATHAEWWVHCR